jgi:hypothetical protein
METKKSPEQLVAGYHQPLHDNSECIRIRVCLSI